MTRLGELLVQQSLVSQEVVDQALRLQVGRHRRLGHILVQMKAISDDQLVDTLACQLDVQVCDIPNNFSSEVRRIIPRYLCQQYGILPLNVISNNILQVAMADPSDDEAIKDLERYTGYAIEPVLACNSEIIREIPRRIPLGLKDLFSPQANTLITRGGIALCLSLVLVISGFVYRYVHETTYGTVSTSADSRIYKNHDLMLGFDKSGKVTLLGHGAYASVYYSVSFDNAVVLYAFLISRQDDLSSKQKSWLDWALSQREFGAMLSSLAMAN